MGGLGGGQLCAIYVLYEHCELFLCAGLVAGLDQGCVLGIDLGVSAVHVCEVGDENVFAGEIADMDSGVCGGGGGVSGDSGAGAVGAVGAVGVSGNSRGSRDSRNRTHILMYAMLSTEVSCPHSPKGCVSVHQGRPRLEQLVHPLLELIDVEVDL
jgi:hypothetical protein